MIRHPRPAIAEGTCYGRSDIDLADDPVAVAARLRAYLPASVPVYSSPLRRCRLLAEQLHDAPVYDERLMEMDFGNWEMQAWNAIDRVQIDRWATDPLDFAPPGGESPAALQARAVAFCTELQIGGVMEAVLVTHAGVIKALCGYREGLPANEWIRLDFKFGSISLIEHDRRVWQNVGHV